MYTFLSRYERYAPVVLRIGIGFVFLWFGWGGLTNTDMWVGLVPAWTTAFAAPATLVKIHGLVELLFGTILIFGFYARIAAAVLLLSLANTLTLVSGPTFIRDIGIATALVSLILNPYQRES
jgi:uncharacterized membrane protein YphA (DoxX/SURF4 family)